MSPLLSLCSLLPHATRQLLQPLPLFNKHLLRTCRRIPSMLLGAGGASVSSLAKHAFGSYLGAFFRVARPLHQRLIAMGGATNRLIDAHLANPSGASASMPWASYVYASHTAATSLHQSFTATEQHFADLIDPPRMHHRFNWRLFICFSRFVPDPATGSNTSPFSSSCCS